LVDFIKSGNILTFLSRVSTSLTLEIG